MLLLSTSFHKIAGVMLLVSTIGYSDGRGERMGRRKPYHHGNLREALLESAELLNRKMKEIRDSGKVVGVDRIAVMAALNLCHEMLQGKTSNMKADERLLGRIRVLNDTLAGALGATH